MHEQIKNTFGMLELVRRVVCETLVYGIHIQDSDNEQSAEQSKSWYMKLLPPLKKLAFKKFLTQTCARGMFTLIVVCCRVSTFCPDMMGDLAGPVQRRNYKVSTLTQKIITRSRTGKK